MAEPVFVAIRIKTPMALLWERTQQPSEHARWDLRFSSITYLPRASPEDPQRFNYETRLGFGLSIAGYGETVGTAAYGQANGETVGAPDSGTSALRFGSADPKSLIREGTGAWLYRQENEQVRFWTVYQYDVRFGRAGRFIDRILFRPLMGWATAWSFDRLRLWLEQGIPPELSRSLALLHVLARLLLGFAWLYHGIVPKLLFPEHGEALMTARAGIFPEHTQLLLSGVALGEILLGLAVWCFGRSRWVLGLAGALLVALTAVVTITQPDTLTAPMNPLTLNLALIGLVVTAWITEPHTPSAGRCLRRKDEHRAIDLPAGARVGVR